MKQERRPTSGNALILILIAIVLLGGLTMLLSRGSQTTEETGDKERTNIKVSEMLRYTSGIEQTIRKLQLNGCSENQISFKTSLWGDPVLYVPLAKFDKIECYVFHDKGGGYPFKKIPDGLQTSASPTNYVITSYYDVNKIGTTAPDLILFAPGLTMDACSQINRTLNVQSYALDAISTTPTFNGTFPISAGPSTIGYNGSNPTYLAGKKAGCLRSTASFTVTGSSVTTFTAADVVYIYYQVLIPR